MSQFPQLLQTLISHLRKLPGVGRKTAERFAFQLLEWPEGDLRGFAGNLTSLKSGVCPCGVCGCLMDGERCLFCASSSRDVSVLCIVASARDVYSIEETAAYTGLYHVLGGLLSPLDGRLLEHLALEKLEKRFTDGQVEEVIIALDSTLEGDATALVLKEKLQQLGVKATRLAFGMPMGSSIDFVDYGTLEKAFAGRVEF